jgi:lysyl-tRNA synthetase class 2
MNDAPRRDRLLARSAAMGAIRRFFEARAFIELDTPLLLPSVPVESSIEPFRVSLLGRGGVRSLFLPTSPEGALKKLLPVIRAPCFEIGHAFRNGEEEGDLHRAWFRMLEWYRPHGTLGDLMDDVRGLALAMAEAVGAAGSVLDPDAAWEVLGVGEALERWAGIDREVLVERERLVTEVRDRDLGRPLDWRDALAMLLTVYVEEHLGWERPTFLVGYPAGLAAQARPLTETPHLAAQFELYVRGIELANCYEENTDPLAQEAAFRRESARMKAIGVEPPPLDAAYLDALARLTEPWAGGSLGVDRLLMLLLGAGCLDEVRP